MARHQCEARAGISAFSRPERALSRRCGRGAPASWPAEQLHRWCGLTRAQKSPGTDLAKASGYFVNHWTALTRFLEDGRRKSPCRRPHRRHGQAGHSLYDCMPHKEVGDYSPSSIFVSGAKQRRSVVPSRNSADIRAIWANRNRMPRRAPRHGALLARDWNALGAVSARTTRKIADVALMRRPVSMNSAACAVLHSASHSVGRIVICRISPRRA